MTGGDALVETLIDWGVDVVFGLPGDGINGVIEALRTRQDRIRFIQVRHEESAAFMACAYAKYTAQLGVCLATSGPGGLHLLNGLYDAKLDGQPVLAITGHTYHDLIDTFSQQDVDLDRVFQDVARYSTRIMSADHVGAVASLACRTAVTRRGVAHINFPHDLQSAEVGEDRSTRNVAHHTNAVRARSPVEPRDEDVRAAARILNGCRKVVILAGRGALGAVDELEAAADQLGAPIVKALLGKAAVPDDSPYTTGGLGLLGTRPSYEVLQACDGLLIVGSSFPYIEFLPKPGQARTVQIDLDPSRIGLRLPVDAAIVGDGRMTLAALVPCLVRKTDRSFLERAQTLVREWRERLDAQVRPDREGPMKPQFAAAALGRRLSPDAIVSCDSGTVTAWWARHIPATRGQMHSVSGTLASMACGLPYAIAAQIAHPSRQSVAFVGDGALSMLMAELATCVKYRLPVRIVVLKNDTLGQIKWEQMAFLGNPEFGCELQSIDFAAVARACGAVGLSATTPEGYEQALDEAFATSGPALVEAVVDPLEPPIPPHVTASQAAHLAEAFLKGTPARGAIARTLVRDRVREMV
jgi:pyruvate dehydrogenase (quinone)/pyruvate oxidase